MIYYGSDLDGSILYPEQADTLNKHYVGPRKLLRLLEQVLGRQGYTERNDYIRIEMYRQALLQQVVADPCAFYAASFEADRFATATVLLEHRDALLLSGWDFKVTEQVPERFRTLAAVEVHWLNKLNDPVNTASMIGDAERWTTVLNDLDTVSALPFDEVVLLEPLELLAVPVQRAFHKIQQQGIPVHYQPVLPQAIHKNGMLGRFQRYVSGEDVERGMPDGMPDIVLLHVRNDTDAATMLAQILRRNSDWRPAFLMPDVRQNLELALILEGLPAFGVLSTTLARPILQVLKLAPAFLWEPVDIFKIMEFVTLPVKPLDRGLALEIARVLAEKPGMFSEQWFGAVLGYLGREQTDPKVKEQYEFWFQRRRYRPEVPAPKREAIAIYAYLREWASESASKDTALLVLSEQARRICDLLETLPEQTISFLELERIVRTIVEPTPAQLAETATGHYPYFHQPGAAIGPVDELIWWNCLYENDAPPPDFWQPAEREWLSQQGCTPEHPATTAQRKLITRIRPILQARKRLWLVLPEQVGGQPAVHSLLPSDMAALFGAKPSTELPFRIPEYKLTRRTLQQPRPQIQVEWTPPADDRHETPTGLESLFYYPHRWYLKQQTGIYPSNLLSVTRDNTLLGNLSHRFFELLFSNGQFVDMEKSDLHTWIDDTSEDLLKKEGATLLLYGREPERKAFLQKVKHAAWSLISLLQSNEWKVVQTEMELKGQFGGLPIKGKADLVLQRGADEFAIVDLKWSGATRRKELIQNEEDLQLILYAYLLPPVECWPHTAYFILETGKMIARNNVAFKEALVAGKGCDDHTEACKRIFEKMERTWQWRRQQLEQGQLEIRTHRTAAGLEEIYTGTLADLLEMKTEDARWDDYRTLIDFMG